MGRALKYLAFLVGGIVALLLIAAVSFMLLFDPNDFRDRIAAETQKATGRELTIEGDLSVSLFPWLAIGVGKSTLGNAPGFGDEPFATFEEARLSVRLLPLLLRREVSVGTAELDSLHLNLEVARDGRNNWDDLAAADEAAPEDAAADAGPAALDIASIDIRNSSLRYRDAQAGATYSLSNINMQSGRVSPGDPVPLAGGLSFDLQPDGLDGELEFDTVATFDTDAATVGFDDLALEATVNGLADMPVALELAAPGIVVNMTDETVAMGAIEVALLGIDATATVEPFSYAGELQPVATFQVDAFSPRSLMQRLEIEVPETADPNALSKLIIEGKASVGPTAIALSNVKMTLDDTRFAGSLSLPADPAGTYRVDMTADSIDLARYMAPAAEAAGSSEEVPVEIPTELIRSFNVRGTLKVERATLGEILFENVDLGLNINNGDLRLQPITASMFDGTYNGDVRINASGATPVLAVNEKISGVQLGALAAAMFDQDNVTGTISGAFVLSGQGDDLAAIQQSLSGNMSFDLADGALEGTDIWYELRRARALLKQEPAPQLELPARTKFSTIRASGPVNNGVFNNTDLLAELPFMRLTGTGTVDFAAATMDYRLSARVFEKPELVQDASPEELKEFTAAVIPVRITGLLTAPSVKPDVQALLKQRAKQELEDVLRDKLLGGSAKQDEAGAGTTAPGDETADETADQTTDQPAEPEEEKSVEDQVKDRLLKKIFER